MQKNTAVVWAVGRPTYNDPANISLYAFNPDKQGTLFSAVAGSWPNTGGDSNIVPVVANGKVFVAADQSLAIFGIGAKGRKVALPSPKHVEMRVALAPGEHELFGRIEQVLGDTVSVRARDGRLVVVDTTAAKSKFDFRQAMDRPRAHGARNLRGQRHDESRPRRPRQGQREDVAVG